MNFLYLPLEYCTVYYNEFPLSSLKVLHCLLHFTIQSVKTVDCIVFIYYKPPR